MRAFLKNIYQYRLSALALIVVNLVPLLGVLFWHWDVFEIVALYWAENVAVGAISAIKMITCRPRPGTINWDQPFTPEELTSLRDSLDDPNHVPGSENDFTEVARLEAAFDKVENANKSVSLPGGTAQLDYVLGFAFFYGWLCLLHGLFVYDLFGGTNAWDSPFKSILQLCRSIYEDLFWPFVALVASHFYSFVVNYLGRGEFRRVTVGSLAFQQPIARVVVLHLAILLTGFLCMVLGSPLPLLVFLVIGKTVLDLLLHLRERERNADGDSRKSQATSADSQSITTGEVNQLPANRRTSAQ